MARTPPPRRTPDKRTPQRRSRSTTASSATARLELQGSPSDGSSSNRRHLQARRNRTLSTSRQPRSKISADGSPQRRQSLPLSAVARSLSAHNSVGSAAFHPAPLRTTTIRRPRTVTPTRSPSRHTTQPASAPARTGIERHPIVNLPPSITMSVRGVRRPSAYNYANPNSRGHIHPYQEADELWLNDPRNHSGTPWPGSPLDRRVERGEVEIVEDVNGRRIVRTIPSRVNQ